MFYSDLFKSFRGRFFLLLGGTLFVGVFFGIFKPFQMAHYSSSEFNLAYGGLLIITICSLGASHFIFPIYFSSSFTKLVSGGKGRVIWILINLVLISFLFFAFKIWFGFYEFTLSRIFTGVLATIAVGAIPVLFFIISDKELKEANDEEVLFVESKGNYLFLHTSNEGVIKMRGTLKEYLKKNDEVVVQTHRAFLVNQNIDWTLEKEGNRYFLSNSQLDQKIPVSRDKRKLFS